MTSEKSLNSVRPVILFTLFYLVLASLFAWRLQNWEFVLYIFVVLLIGLMVMTIHTKVQFSRGVLWTLSIWGLMHMLGGLLPISHTLPIAGDTYVLYNLWLIPELFKYDHLVHMYGFGICTWGCWQVLKPLIKGSDPHPSEIIISVLAANGLGAGNEIIEFLAVLLIPNTNVGGYINTGWDLVANLTGSVIAALIITYGDRLLPTKKHLT